GKLFLAGIEVEDDSVAPEGWTKWVVPAYEYIQVKNQIGAEESAKTWLSGNNLELVGPVLRVSNLMDMTDTLCFPVKKI
ncbi:MAG TPA: AraC family transcriptional regulator, partial [Bacillota bacterium]|nr:AraC family transcriptional regulator [Bacillota bacterium]